MEPARRPAWGTRARIGILVNHNDAVPESEFWSIIPDHVTVHAARFQGPRSRGAEYPEHSAALLAESPELKLGVTYLSRMQVDVICLCFSTPSYMAEPGFDDELVAALAGSRALPMTTAAAATTAAMEELGIGRPLLVTPPWFDDSLNDAIERHFTKLGRAPAATRRLSLGRGWDDLKPFEIYDAGGQWEVDPSKIYRQLRRAIPAGADGIVIAGNGIRAAESIAWLEEDTGLPMITANQACVWHSLVKAGLRTPVVGYGRLLARLGATT